MAVPSSIMEQHETGERFMRQLLLHRYATLLKKLEEVYPLSEQQKQALQEKILTIDWVDRALKVES